MVKQLRLNLAYFIPVLLILFLTCMYFLGQSSWFNLNPDALSLGITADLLIVMPLIYYILIRKRDIPNVTVVPVFLIGIVAAGFILPNENQVYLEFVKTWILPIVELTIISVVIWKVRKASKYYAAHKTESPDFFTALKEACAQIVPKQVVHAFATEIAIFYYGFINWKRIDLKQNEFSYHKDSPVQAILIFLLFLIPVETFVFHILLMKWSSVAAWTLSALSIYSGFQVFGLLRSISKIPIVLEDKQLILRYGIFGESRIDYRHIQNIEYSSSDYEINTENRHLSILGNMTGHNVILRLSGENLLTGFYGIRKNYRNIAFHVDDLSRFKDMLNKKMDPGS